jgi:hypothetical protein
MGTKLESLIKVLIDEGTEQYILDKLVLNYFDKQYVDSFETSEGVYEVLTKKEKEDQLYDIAEGLFYDYQKELERLAKHSDNRTLLSVLIESLDEREGIAILIDNLDFEEELNKDLVGSDRDYFVYTEG